jgi:hypothetical protein
MLDKQSATARATVQPKIHQDGISNSWAGKAKTKALKVIIDA